MKLIEQRIISALRSGKPFVQRKDGRVINAVDRIEHLDDCIEPIGYAVLLHGNCIATYYPVSKRLDIYDCGWQSRTTKSRLNALLDAFAPGYYLRQRNRCFELVERRDHEAVRQWNGKAEFEGYVCIAS